MQNYEPNQVELQQILRACLQNAEKILNSTLQNKYNKPICLITALSRIQILLGRLLVLFRWRKRASPDRFKKLINQNSSLHLSIPRFPPLSVFPKFGMPNLGLDLTVDDIYPPKMPFINIFANIVFHTRFYSQIRQFKVSKRRIFLKTDMFSFIAKWKNISKTKKKKKKYFVVERVNIIWPNSITNVLKKNGFPLKNQINSFFKEKNEKKYFFSIKDPEKFREFIIVIQNLYTIGQFVYIAQTLQDLKTDFFFEMIYNINDLTLDITFPDGFNPYNRFQLILTKDNRIILRSLSTLYFPDLENRSSNYAKQTSESFTQAQLRKFYEFAFTEFCPTNIKSILTQIHGYLVYTRLKIAFNLLQKSIRCLPFLNLDVEIKCNVTTVSCSFLTILLSGSPKVMLNVDVKSGSIILSNLEANQFDLTYFTHCFDGDVGDVSRFLQCFMISRVINFHFYILGRHFGILMIPSNLPPQHNFQHWCFSLSLSFAPDFHVMFLIRPGSPDYYVMSNKMELIKSTKLIEYMSINSIHRTISDAVFSNKVLLVSLQLEKDLRDLGCKVKRHEGRMTILMNPLMKVQLKIRADGYWALVFHRQFYPFLQPGLLTITGARFTCRMAHRLINIIKGVTFNRSLMRNASTTCGIGGFSIENDLAASLCVEKYNINLGMSPFSDSFTIGDSGYFVSNSFSPLKLHADFNRHFPFPLYWMNDNADTFGAFLHSSLPSLIKFKEVMNSDGWTTSFLSATDSFYLVYKKRVTLNIQMKPLQCFAVVIPNFGVSSLLQIPLSIFPKFYRLIKLTHHTYKVHITELALLRERVSSFFEDFAVLSQGGFRVRGLQEHAKAAMMVASNASFNVQATLEVQGMKIFCEESPILTKVCKKLNEHFFESNRRVFLRAAVKFVCSLAKCDPEMANMALAALRQILKKKWREEMRWEKCFKEMKVDQENNCYKFAIFTENGYISYIEVLKKGNNSKPVVVATRLSQEKVEFQEVQEFKEWLKNEVASNGQ